MAVFHVFKLFKWYQIAQNVSFLTVYLLNFQKPYLPLFDLICPSQQRHFVDWLEKKPEKFEIRTL